MSPVAVRAEGLSKRYRIGAAQERGSYKSLRESLTEASAGAARRLAGRAVRPVPETIWALRDVSFQLQHGEVLGIVGRNGAGKSTLLKILSRITEPTRGEARVRGRVGSLLEVGTGFHPELTGRENVYLNGAILGMPRAEIDRKFDEIVAFAEVSKFLDTPVKRYSSGMAMRLGFSVAAHLEPEVLVVDEVLAVGDAAFQRKCLGKMHDVSREGRTVLFVSHNMSAITRLCERALLLDQGGVVADGPAPNVVSLYLTSNLGAHAVREWPDPATAPGNEVVRMRRVRVRDQAGQTLQEADIRRPVGIDMEFEVVEPGWVLQPDFHFYNEEGLRLFVTFELQPAWRDRPRPVGRYTSTVWVPGNFLAEGTHILKASISTMNPFRVHVAERDVVAFQVVDSMEGDSARGEYGKAMPGVIRPLLDWTTQFEPTDPETAT